MLDAEPWFFSHCSWMAENFVSEIPEVGVGWKELLACAILPSERLAHDKDVVTSTEGIGEVGDRSHDDFGIFSSRLVA